MAAKIFRINYKSDFILTMNSDAGWAIPFCIKFCTSVPSRAYFVGFDGTTYTHCAYDPSEPTKLVVQFDDHHLPIGDLNYQIAYHFTVADFPNDTEDEVINPATITTEIDGETYHVMLDFTGETAPEIEFSLPAYANEQQRIQNELQRQQNEADRIAAELQREQATAAAVQGAENVNAQLNGTTLTVTNRQGVSTSVNTKGEQGEQGPVGPEGPQGEQGAKGEKGDTGATGPQGVQGPAGPQGQTGVSITDFVKTGETETDTLYDIEFSDDTTKPVAIPKGEKGDQGEQGPEGPQGPMGDVAVITPEQQAAFTMYSETGQNTNGPMTQKAVTDAIGNIAASGVSYDNSQSGLTSNNVQGALDETNDKITTRLLRVNFSVTVNVAVNKDGTYRTSKANGWCVTEPLTFSKGDVIILTATGAPTSALLSKVVVDKSSYIPILRFTQSNVEEVVKYVVEEDGQYAACAHKDTLNIQIYSFGLDYAKGIKYLNLISGLKSTNVQDVIDETNERLLPLEKIAENNEFITKITYDDLTTGRCVSSANIIGRATTLSFLEKNNTYKQASYTQQVVKGQQFIVHNAYSYLNGGAYGYIIVNGGCLTEQFPQWLGQRGGNYDVATYDIIITCKTNGTIYINIAEDGYILKIDERIKIKDDSQYENVDCELCTHSITVSDDTYGVNFWTTGMIDDNGIMHISYQCGAVNSGSAGEGNLGGMSHFSIAKPWISESELTPYNTVIDDIAMNYPSGYMIKEITDNVIVRHLNYSIGSYGCICNWNKTQGTCVKNTITYDGNTVDYNLYNISQMLIDKGILEGSASGNNHWDYTRQVKSDGYYWTMERSAQSSNICPVILKSLDCVNWEYVGAIPSITHIISESGIVVKDGVMYAVWRKDLNSDNNLTEYFIYDLNNNTLLLDETNISGTINSRPSAFLYQENVYFVVNEISSIYNFHERRLQVAIYRVMPDYTLDRVYTLADANGINYHDVIVHGSYEDIYLRPSTYPHYATDQSVYMVYTSDRRHITTGGRKLSDIQLLNITPCLQPKYAGMQRYVNWEKAGC